MKTENLKERDILCRREYNYWNKTYNWEFQEVRKINHTGKIRLMNGKLIDSLGIYNVYNEEMKQIFAKDKIRNSILSMLYCMNYNKAYIINQMSMEDMCITGVSLEMPKVMKIKIKRMIDEYNFIE